MRGGVNFIVGPQIQPNLYGCDIEGSKIITDGRASDHSSQVIADGGRRDVVGKVFVKCDVEDGHPSVDQCSLFTLLSPLYNYNSQTR